MPSLASSESGLVVRAGWSGDEPLSFAFPRVRGSRYQARREIRRIGFIPRFCGARAAARRGRAPRGPARSPVASRAAVGLLRASPRATARRVPRARRRPRRLSARLLHHYPAWVRSQMRIASLASSMPSIPARWLMSCRSGSRAANTFIASRYSAAAAVTTIPGLS